MIPKLKELSKGITWKHWLVLLVLSQAIYILMLTVTIPLIRQEAGAMQIFDMSPFGYTYETARLFLARLTVEGYHLYRTVQLPLDIFFPVLNSLFGICTLTLLIGFYNKDRNKETQEKYFTLIFCLPISAMISDYLENIMILIMLSYKASVPKAIVMAANIFTIAKSMSTTLFYIAIVILLIMVAVQKLNNNKRVKADGEL